MNEPLVVTFKLHFPPNVQGLCLLKSALLDLGSRLPSASRALFRHWHASIHIQPGVPPYELWFQFSVRPSQVELLVDGMHAALTTEGARVGFQYARPLPMTEPEAFGEGDPRPGYDVYTATGAERMPDLWTQVQLATEWALEDLRKGAPRALPATLDLPWARHIYENLMWLLRVPTP